MIGQTLGGAYRILELVASGGFGDVYLARDLRSNRVVAVKTLHPHLARDEGMIARFRREARTARALSGPHVVRLLDEGEHDGTFYLVMEYVQGLTLAQIVRARGPLPIPEAVGYASQMLDALAEAHRLGILHRDVKPVNVMVNDGLVKVMDFGIAKNLLAETMLLTSASVILGTPRYMSPEQVRGEPADARSDLYAVAVTLYELLAGQPPFSAETPHQVLQQQVSAAPPPITVSRPDVPPALADVLTRGLEKDRARRYQTADEMRQALENAVGAGGAATTVLERPLARADARGGATGVGSPSSGGEADLLATLRAQARDHVADQQWTEAVRVLARIVAEAPEDDDAARGLEEARRQQRLARLYADGAAAHERRDWLAAIGSFEQLRALDPAHSDVADRLARLRREKALDELYHEARRLDAEERWDEVVAAFDRMRGIDLNPPDPDALLARARERLELLAREQVLAERYGLALRHLNAREWPEARGDLDAIAAIDPDYRETRSLLARVRREVGDRTPSGPLRPIALPSDVDSPTVFVTEPGPSGNLGIGPSAEAVGPTAGRPDADGAAAPPQAPSPPAPVASRASRARLIALGGGALLVVVALALVVSLTGRNGGAQPAVSTPTPEPLPSSSPLKVIVAVSPTLQPPTEIVVPTESTALPTQTPLPAAPTASAAGFVDQGNAHFDNGEYDLALADFGKALDLEPGNPGAYVGQGNVYSRQGKLDEALAAYNQALSLDPKNAYAYDGRAYTYSLQGKLDLAIADETQAIALDPNFVYAYNGRANGYVNQGKPDLALADYGKAIALDPKFVSAYVGRGGVYANQGDYPRAIVDYNRAIELDPKNVYAYDGRAFVYRKQGKHDLAIADDTRAISLDHSYVYAYVGRGSDYYAQGKLDLALADLNQAIAIDPGDDTAYEVRGYLYRDQKKNALALADFRKYLELSPGAADHAQVEQVIRQLQ